MWINYDNSTTTIAQIVLSDIVDPRTEARIDVTISTDKLAVVVLYRSGDVELSGQSTPFNSDTSVPLTFGQIKREMNCSFYGHV